MDVIKKVGLGVNIVGILAMLSGISLAMLVDTKTISNADMHSMGYQIMLVGFIVGYIGWVMSFYVEDIKRGSKKEK